MTGPDSAGISRRELAWLGVIAVSYFLAHQVAFLFPDAERVLYAVWPAGGIGLAALLLNRRGIWGWIVPALFVAGVSASLTQGRPLYASVGYMIANVTESVLCAWFMTWACGGDIRFSRIREVCALVASAIGLNAVSALVGAGTASLAGSATFGAFWLTWWVADGLGILLVTPLILTWRHIPAVRGGVRRYVEFAAFAAVWGVGGWWAFKPGHEAHPLTAQPYMLVALLGWPALRMGQRGTTLALSFMAGIAIAHQGGDPRGMTVSGQEQLLAVQVLLGCSSMAALMLAAGSAEAAAGRKRLRTLGDTLANGVLCQVVSQPDGRKRFVYMGARSETVLGVRAEDALAHPEAVFGRIVEEDRAMVAEAEGISARDMAPFNVVPRLRMPDGSIRWIRVSGTPVKLDDGGILWEAVQTDITAEKKAEQELRASEERYRFLVNNTELPVVVTTLPDGRVLFANEATGRFAGAPSPALLGRSAADFWCDPAERERWLAQLEADGRILGFEAWLRTGTGELRWCSISSSAIDFEGCRAAFSILSDITGLKKAQQELERERAFLHTLIQTIPVPIWLKDTNGVYTACNPAFQQVLGLADSAVTGRTDHDLLPNDQADRIRAHDRDTIQTGRTSVYREPITNQQNGQRVLLEITKAAMRDSTGRVMGALGVGRDITVADRAEQVLRERIALQEQLEHLAATAPGAIYKFRIGPDGAVSLPYASPAIVELCGSLPGERAVSARAIWECVHPDDRQRLRTSIEHSRRTLSPWREDFRVMGASASIKWVHGHSIPVREADGGTVWHGILTDVTERKAVERLVADDAERHRVLVEQSKDGIALVDPDGKACAVNESFAEMLGYSREEMLGMRVWEWDIRLPEEQFPGRFEQLMKERRTFETTHRRKDGSTIEVEVSVNGAAVEGRQLLYGVHRDVSARKAAEEALRRSEEMYRYLVEGGTEGIWMAGADGKTTFVNPQMSEMLGYRTGEMIGRGLDDFADDETRAAMSRRALELKSGIPARTPQTLVHKDGRKVPVLASSRFLFDDAGHPVGTLSMITDLTEYKRMEQLLYESQRSESIALLAGGVAHDFNNLLTPILGLSEILRETASGHDAEMLDSIMTAGRSAADLTRQLLAYSGKGQMYVAEVDVSRMVREMQSLLRASVNRGVTLDFSIDNGVVVRTDPGQIRQVILNLVMNGAEAIGEDSEGRVSVSVSRRTLGDGQIADDLTGGYISAGDYAAIEVTDTGCGMDAQLKSRIFDPFVSTKFMGRGLGLAAVAGIARSLHGGVRVTTAPGAGSTFLVLLLASSAPVAAKGSASQPVEAGATEILVVDDEPLLRSMIGSMLERHGFSALMAGNGREGLDILAANRGRIRGVMLDISMPVMGGKRMLEIIDSRWPDLPVLIMSGFSQSEVLRMLGGHRKLEFLEKPFDLSKMRECVRRTFGEPGGKPPTS